MRQGGRYIRQKDGTLQRTQWTEPALPRSAPDPATERQSKPDPKSLGASVVVTDRAAASEPEAE